MKLNMWWLVVMSFITTNILLSSNNMAVQAQTFAEQQLQHYRVQEAQSEKNFILRSAFKARGLSFPPKNIYLRAFKKEGIIELWVEGYEGRFIKFKDYVVCASSGDLGPKRRQGDHQVPEGHYYIDKFNPESSYFLSLGINYPNHSDSILGQGSDLGGDIYIHGSCKTVGCLPISNSKIKELYWLCVLAKDSGQKKIRIDIYPFKFDNFVFYQQEFAKHKNRPDITSFWDKLRISYNYFERNRHPQQYNIAANGTYVYY